MIGLSRLLLLAALVGVYALVFARLDGLTPLIGLALCITVYIGGSRLLDRIVR